MVFERYRQKGIKQAVSEDIVLPSVFLSVYFLDRSVIINLSKNERNMTEMRLIIMKVRTYE